MIKIHIIIGSIVTMFMSWNIHLENQKPIIEEPAVVEVIKVEPSIPSTMPPTTTSTTTTTIVEKMSSQAVPANPVKRCPDLEPIFEAKGMKPVETWSYIAYAESRCQSRAVGWNYHKGMSRADCGSGKYEIHKKCEAVRSWDIGVLQVNSSWRSVTRRICGGEIEMLFDLDCNFAVAKYLFENGGFDHWMVMR